VVVVYLLMQEKKCYITEPQLLVLFGGAIISCST
jgi:hypothetical protein